MTAPNLARSHLIPGILAATATAGAFFPLGSRDRSGPKTPVSESLQKASSTGEQDAPEQPDKDEQDPWVLGQMPFASSLRDFNADVKHEGKMPEVVKEGGKGKESERSIPGDREGVNGGAECEEAEGGGAGCEQSLIGFGV